MTLAVAVFCASSTRVDRRHVDLAGEVGAELARRGWSLVSGGGSVSMMGAVAREARAGGATTVGVIPRALADSEIADTDSDELVVVETMRERKAEMERRADAFLTLPGGVGTLEELLEIWTARSLGMHTKPVVVLDPDGVLAPLRTLVEALARDGFVRPAALAVPVWTTTVPAALDACAAVTGAVAGGLTSAPPEDLLEAQP